MCTLLLVGSNVVSGRLYLLSGIPPLSHETRSFANEDDIVYGDPRGGVFVFGWVECHTSEGVGMQ